MTAAAPPRTDLPALPHWETTPADLPAAIRAIKAAIRARIEASGRTVAEVFAVVEERIRGQVEQIEAERGAGETVWPVVEYADIANGTVSVEQLAKLHRRGCLVVRGHFPREQALGWDADLVAYVESNRFFDNYAGPADDFFGSVGSKPEIYPVYWSPSQMQARQSERMAMVQEFLNGQWSSESDGTQWFDPHRDSLYPDRIRRRPEGATSGGLGTHLDPGTLDLWMTEAYQNAFRHLFDGSVEQYDPWDAAHRTAGPQYPGSTMCSVFRTFQGWTALSDMAHDQGVLHTVPIPGAMAYLMLRPLLSDVADDDMCGVTTNQTFPANETWHPLLMRALSGIPDVRAGDSVWWHCDMVHSVAPVTDQQGWGNVMYIPAAPWCPRNEAYSAVVREAFLTGSSPGDFPEEHYERSWDNRFHVDDLNAIGRRGARSGFVTTPAVFDLAGIAFVVREAVAADVAGIVGLLAEDRLAHDQGGGLRDGVTDAADLEPYLAAFAEIEADPAHQLVVGEVDGALVATLQFSVLPGLARRGARRAQVEAVRVRSDFRSRGLGAALLGWAVDEARRRDCGLVQLTTDKARVDAHRFYARLGFVASHEGFKMLLDGVAGEDASSRHRRA